MYTAVIWDCDGVLVDSEKLSCSAWLPVLRRRGIDVELSDIEVFIGRSDPSVVEHYRQAGHDLGDDIFAEREQVYYDSARGTLDTFDGLIQTLQMLREAGVPIAVGSSGGPSRIQFSIREVGIADYFDIICSAADVEHGKPAPDLFLLAAEQLGVPAHQCIVIEDSIPGLEAALAAGMLPLGFTSSHPTDVLERAGAGQIFGQYTELTEILRKNLQIT